MEGISKHVMMILVFTVVMLYPYSHAHRGRHHFPHNRVQVIVNIGNGKGRSVYTKTGWIHQPRLIPKPPSGVGRYCTQPRTRKQPRDCRDAVDNGCRGKAVTWIKPRGTKGFWAYCEGPWTVIQRRWDGGVNFYRPWKDYALGFPRSPHGQLDPRHDFWVGNDNLHALTSQRKVKLKVELWKQKAHMEQKKAYKYEEYVHFLVGNRKHKYILQVSGPSGTAGDCLSGHNGKEFSTYDRDHDKSVKTNCAVQYKGAWWYGSCHSSNLNGIFHRSGNHKTFATGVNWQCSHGYHYSLRDVMKIY